MDPVTAFSLIGSAFQLFDCGSRFVSLAHRLYKKGSDAATNFGAVEAILGDLELVLPQFTNEDHSEGVDEGLAQLTKACSSIAARMSSILKKVTVSGDVRKVDALKASFRSMCKAEEIESLERQLHSLMSQISFRFLVSLRQHMSRNIVQQDESLRKLGIVHDQTLNVGQMVTSIYSNLAPKSWTTNEYIQGAGLRDEFAIELSKTLAKESNQSSQDIQMSPSGFQKVQRAFCASLEYDQMDDRESRIAIAHEATFKWIFEQPEQSETPQPSTWSDFPKWLESDHQLYWITGKAGSGKSTLMKFLSSPLADEIHQKNTIKSEMTTKIGLTSRCHLYLQKWAGQSRLITSSFYFWNSGQQNQMTFAGLLRTILHQMLHQCPEITPEVAPSHWEASCLFGAKTVLWSETALQKAVLQAVQILAKTSKICFFIDGLDEFAHSHQDLIALVKTLVQYNDHVKVCVASRPWNVFEDALHHNPSLRLEDLTFHDMKLFIESKFHADAEFETLQKRYPSFASQLVLDIVKKASGVFLWVNLVCQSLLAGMSQGDRIQDLQARLEELPPELDKLYEKILYSLEKRHLEHASQYFALVEAAHEPLTLLQFAFADEESPQTALNTTCGSFSTEELELRAQAMRRRLNSRCKGFLEASRISVFESSAGGRVPCKLSAATVQYLHRTVRDFIKSPAAQNHLLSTRKSTFDPWLQLCSAFLIEDKLRPRDRHNLLTQQLLSHEIVTFDARAAKDCMQVAVSISAANEAWTISLLDDLRNSVQQRSQGRILANFDQLTADAHFERNSAIEAVLPMPLQKDNVPIKLAFDTAFLCLAAQLDVIPYLKAKGAITNFGSKYDYPSLLASVLSIFTPNVAVIDCVLDLGAKVGFQHLDSKAWIFALESFLDFFKLQNETYIPGGGEAEFPE